MGRAGGRAEAERAPFVVVVCCALVYPGYPEIHPAGEGRGGQGRAGGGGPGEGWRPKDVVVVEPCMNPVWNQMNQCIVVLGDMMCLASGQTLAQANRGPCIPYSCFFSFRL